MKENRVRFDWRSFLLGVVLAGAASIWAARFQKEAVDAAVPVVYREDNGCFLIECAIESGKRRIAVLVPISHDYEFYTAPAIVWTLPCPMDEISSAAGRLSAEGLDLVFKKYGPYTGGAVIPGRRD